MCMCVCVGNMCTFVNVDSSPVVLCKVNKISRCLQFEFNVLFYHPAYPHSVITLPSILGNLRHFFIFMDCGWPMSFKNTDKAE